MARWQRLRRGNGVQRTTDWLMFGLGNQQQHRLQRLEFGIYTYRLRRLYVYEVVSAKGCLRQLWGW